MNVNLNAIQAMRRTIRKRDLPGFQAVLDQRLDLWTSGRRLFMMSRRSSQMTTLLHKLTTSEFNEGLQCYLTKCWQSITSADALSAFNWSIMYGSSKAVLYTFLQAAIAQQPSFLQRRQIFYYTMQHRLYDLAARTIQLPGFEATVRMSFRTPNVVWDLPIHEAVAHHQTGLIELLMERRAVVDTLSDSRISPLMIACHLIYPNIVVQLLRHGANPNYPPVTTYACRMSLRKLTKRLSAERGRAVDLTAPLPSGSLRAQSLQAKADYILQLLIEAGLRVSSRRFIHHSTVKRHLSTAMAQRLKHLSSEVRSLQTLALVKIRDHIRFRCKGVGFYETVNNLDIPDSVKKQITFRVRN